MVNSEESSTRNTLRYTEYEATSHWNIIDHTIGSYFSMILNDEDRFRRNDIDVSSVFYKFQYFVEDFTKAQKPIAEPHTRHIL